MVAGHHHLPEVEMVTLLDGLQGAEVQDAMATIGGEFPKLFLSIIIHNTDVARICNLQTW